MTVVVGNNANYDEVIEFTARLDEVRRSVDNYMDRYATNLQEVGRLQRDLERAKDELMEERRS